MGPIGGTRTTSATTTATASEELAALSLLEARMEESMSSVHNRCKLLENKFEEHVESGTQNCIDISERLDKRFSLGTNAIISSTHEMTKAVAIEFAGRLDKLSNLVALWKPG